MKRYLNLTRAIYMFLFVMCVGVSSPFSDENVPEWFVVSGSGSSHLIYLAGSVDWKL